MSKHTSSLPKTDSAVTKSKRFTLHLFNKNYSSWSWRVRYPFEQLNIPYDAKFYDISVHSKQSTEELKRLSPSGLAPLLVSESDGAIVWESLAILEFVAEDYPDLWPADRVKRAKARSISAEMHSGFSTIRHSMPANLRRRYGPQEWSPAVLKEIHRALSIFEECRSETKLPSAEDEGFLFGRFSIADAMYAPIVSRFLTYSVDTFPDKYPLAHEYMENVRNSKGWLTILAEAEKDELLVPQYENVYPNVLNPAM